MSTALENAALTYERATYTLDRYEVVCPSVRNDGTVSDYAERFRLALAADGFTGWTEIATDGYWLGTIEPGITFVIYASAGSTEVLGRAARACMPDQMAIQVVTAPAPVTLTEY